MIDLAINENTDITGQGEVEEREEGKGRGFEMKEKHILARLPRTERRYARILGIVRP